METNTNHKQTLEHKETQLRKQTHRKKKSGIFFTNEELQEAFKWFIIILMGLVTIIFILLIVITDLSTDNRELTNILKDTATSLTYTAKENSDEKKNSIEIDTNTQQVPYDVSEIVLLAKCVQAEAGSYKGHAISQRMVTRVILNRVNSSDFPDTIREVIYQNNTGIQFSVAYDGALDRQVLTPETICNVYSAILDNDVNVPENVLYFYASDLEGDNWVKTLKIYDSVQGTTFCYNIKENM